MGGIPRRSYLSKHYVAKSSRALSVSNEHQPQPSTTRTNYNHEQQDQPQPRYNDLRSPTRIAKAVDLPRFRYFVEMVYTRTVRINGVLLRLMLWQTATFLRLE